MQDRQLRASRPALLHPRGQHHELYRNHTRPRKFRPSHRRRVRGALAHVNTSSASYSRDSPVRPWRIPRRSDRS
jgi:hypothetical protein